jgi:ribonuclease J
MSNYPISKNKADKRAPKDTVRVIAFGGLEQVGINCMGFEYNNEVLIVDMGLQFPDQYSNGISFRVPDLSYLNGKKVV